MNEQPVLTMKDIARELGISVATVSRALRDSPRISEERRRMVQQYARDHNFSPNVLAESLRHHNIIPARHGSLLNACQNAGEIVVRELGHDDTDDA